MKYQVAFTDEDFDQLVEQIKAAPRPKGAHARGVQEDFCTSWSSIKQGLEVLKGILDFVPGVGGFVKIGITIVISAGDAAVKALCQG